MKKILFFLISFLLISFNVNAENGRLSEYVELVSLTNKCSVVSDRKISIPVKVVAKNEGILTEVIPEYTLGSVNNNDEIMRVSLNNIDSTYLTDIRIDYNKNIENRSFIFYKVKEDFSTKKLDVIMSFNVDVEFLGEIPNTFYLLGDEIVISDDSLVCEFLNGFKITEIEKTKYVYSENESK